MRHNRISAIILLSTQFTILYSQNNTNLSWTENVYAEQLANYYLEAPNNYGGEAWWNTNYLPLFSSSDAYKELSCSGGQSQSYNDFLRLTDPTLYRYVKTQSDYNKYSILEVTTCCYGAEYYFDEFVDTPDLYCDLNSSDTVLYLLTYDTDNFGNSAAELKTTVDDDNTNICNDTFKSTIDLSLADPDTYFVGVTGYYGFPGFFHIEINCVEFDYPPSTASLQSHATLNHVGDITCDEILYNQENTKDRSISYYNFSVDENTETPIIISTCNPLNESGDVSPYETHLYLIRESGGASKSYVQITSIEDSYDCDENQYAAHFEVTSLVDTKQYGTYYIGVGGEANLLGRFSLSLQCGVEPEEQDITQLIIIIAVIGVLALGCLICFCCFYCRQLKAYKQQRAMMKQLSADNKAEPMVGRQKSKPDEIELQEVGIDGDENNRDIKGRRLTVGDIDENPDMDMVVAVMRDIIQACEDEDGLDVYQVLAFRKNDANSHQLKLIQPMKKWGCACDILQFSVYNRAWFVAVVVFLLQVIGITVILFSVTVAKYDEDELGCAWGFDDWLYKNNWMFKILAFLWALVITLNIGSAVTQMQLSGFNQVIERIDVTKYKSFDIVDMSLIELGYMVNLYTLLVAVFGSYFIVFTSKGGADAIDMVLNAVALFFMIELDDMLVTHEDYEEVFEGAQAFLKAYIDRNSVMSDNKDEILSKQACSEGNLTRLTKCVDHFGFFIRFVAFIGGLCAPIWIVICYDGVHGGSD